MGLLRGSLERKGASFGGLPGPAPWFYLFPIYPGVDLAVLSGFGVSEESKLEGFSVDFYLILFT